MSWRDPVICVTLVSAYFAILSYIVSCEETDDDYEDLLLDFRRLPTSMQRKLDLPPRFVTPLGPFTTVALVLCLTCCVALVEGKW